MYSTILPVFDASLLVCDNSGVVRTVHSEDVIWKNCVCCAHNEESSCLTIGGRIGDERIVIKEIPLEAIKKGKSATVAGFIVNEVVVGEVASDIRNLAGTEKAHLIQVHASSRSTAGVVRETRIGNEDWPDLTCTDTPAVPVYTFTV